MMEISEPELFLAHYVDYINYGYLIGQNLIARICHHSYPILHLFDM